MNQGNTVEIAGTAWTSINNSIAIGNCAETTEHDQIVLRAGPQGSYIILGHDSVIMNSGGEDFHESHENHHNDRKSYDRCKKKVIINDIDFNKLSDDVEILREQMQALLPQVNYAREQAARKIQNAWRRYMYAPGTGKIYRIAKEDYLSRENK